MALYEHVILVRQDVTAQQVEAINEQYKGVIEANAGKVTKTEYWGVKTLAFRIKKNRKGHYMLLGLDAKASFITEMERKLGLNEDVLRFMTIRIDAIDEAPSAILSRKSDERERLRKQLSDFQRRCKRKRHCLSVAGEHKWWIEFH